MLNVRANRAGFQRLRTIGKALRLQDADKRGPVLTALNQVHVRQVRQAFSSRGATVATGPWPPWSPKYARWRSKFRTRLGNRMMRFTDTLHGKATSTTHGDYIGQWLGGLRFAFGFRDDVGFWHQHGMAGPVRSLIEKTAAQHRQFVDAFVRFYRAHVRRVARAVGRR